MNKASMRAVEMFGALPDEALVSVDAASTITSRGVSTIWKECKSGAFPKPCKVGRSTRWTAGSIRAWLKARAAS